MNKIRITESQYYKLKRLIFETSFDIVAKNVIKVGDIVRISYKNSVNNFKVIESINGQITMDNVDSGSALINYRYFMSFTGLHGNKLEIRRVHKTKEKNILNNVRNWKPLIVNDIVKIEVIRDNKVIDSVDENDINGNSKQNDTPYEMTEDDTVLLDNIKHEISKVDVHHSIIFKLDDGGTITFCVVSKNNLTFDLEVSSLHSQSKKYNVLLHNNIELFFNDDLDKDISDKILYKDKNKIKLLLKIKSNNSTFYLDFDSVKLGGFCGEPKSNDDEPDKEKIKQLSRDAIKNILNDPDLKNAFYKEPSLFNMIVAASKGKKADGVGILPALKLVNKYNLNKIKNNIGDSANFFKIGKKATFNVVKPINIGYNDGKESKTLEFKTDLSYTGTIKMSDFIEIDKVFANNIHWKVIIKNQIPNEENTYISDISIYEIKKNGEIKTLGTEKNVKIRMVKSNGYIPVDEKNI